MRKDRAEGRDYREVENDLPSRGSMRRDPEPKSDSGTQRDGDGTTTRRGSSSERSER